MKKKSLIFLPILIMLFILLTKYHGATRSFILDFINPIKIAYLKLNNISDSYLKQEKAILELQKENKRLKKLLIEESSYIDQLSKIYKLIPSLAKKPYKNIFLVDTISYVKLNHLDEIILTTPKKLKVKDKKLYGLMQDDYAAGVAYSIDKKLYAYLLTNSKCTFSVTIGKKNAKGIAQGDGKNGMIVKFIPRWSEVEIGDIVKTSGLDSIFFPNIPVGIVTNVKTLDTYKLATIKIFANVQKPSIFFLIFDPTPYLTTDYNPQNVFPNKVYPFIKVNNENNSENNQTTQTKDNTLNPEQIKEENYMNLLNGNLIFNKKIDLNY